ncbi:unnamed protein product [Periconia digitata]|uniref:beta-fructofuranosidase n=1 Tax=Periconia digitata TaxID=1303443 RepID=A0A9W4UNC1_9PLEO|nr:unnamed protein product [Periconia digitata]
MPSATSPSPSRYSRPSDSQAAADAIPILIDGEYHIFHLSTPPNTIRHPPRLRSTWSRMRSHDLLSWNRDSVEALYPGKTKDSPDADGAWTGSAIIGPDGNMHLFYTGYNLAHGGKQVIIHARSNDRQGSAFYKSPSIISISGDMSQFEDIDFRDAHVSWNECEGRFWMLVATRLKNGPFWTRGCLALLTSVDLEDWAIEREPFYAPNDMFCPECPEIFSLPNGRWYLVYSRFHAPDAGTVYRMADTPRGPFRVPRDGSGGRLDARRWYAAKSCPKAGDSSKRVSFGWIADKLDGQWSWGGDLAIPREVSADESGCLIIKPSPILLESTFRHRVEGSQIPPEIEMKSVGTTKTRYLPVEDPDYCLKFNIASHDAASFGLLFRTDKDMKGYRLRFVPIRSGLYDISLMICPPPLDDFWADQYALHLPREVDGPEFARHAAIDIRGSVVVVSKSGVLQIFVGGKSLSFRLTNEDIAGDDECDTKNKNHVNGNGLSSAQPAQKTTDTRELGFYVQDGALSLADIQLCGNAALV